MLTITFVLAALVHQGCSTSVEGSALKSLSRRDFPSIISQPDIQVVYFSREPDNDRSQEEAQTEDHTLQMFKREYEKSAEHLSQYNINLYTVDCGLEKIADYCSQEKVYLQVFIFRDEMVLMQIGVESMFDVDSIMSNILQLALLREVPILQSVQERTKLENQYRGQKDIIFSFQNAIGTADHRIFMEAAFLRPNNIKFAITTDLAATNDLPDVDSSENAALWLIQSKNYKKSKVCPVAKYYGPTSVSAISEYINNLDLQPIRELAGHEDEDPFLSTPLNTVYVFYDEESRQYVYNEAKHLTRQFRGNIGMLMVNVEKVDIDAIGFSVEGQIPVLAIRKKQTDTFVAMLSTEEPENFIVKYLKDIHSKSKSKMNGDGTVNRLDFLSEVEKQDDEIALAIGKLKSKEINYDPVVLLTEESIAEELKMRDMMVVFFHLPFDALSTAAMYSYIQAAEIYAMEHTISANTNPFGLVNCYNWPTVCSKYNISTWPTVGIVRKNLPLKIHKGVMSPQAFKKATELYSLPAPVPVTTIQEIENLFNPQTTLTMTSDPVIVGFADNKEGEDIIRHVSQELHGERTIHMASGTVAKEWSSMAGVSLPRFSILKPKDEYQPQRDVELVGLSVADLVQAVRNAARPVLIELAPDNLPQLQAKKLPLVIFFTSSPQSPDFSDADQGTMDNLGNLASSGQYSSFIFTWMDKDKQMTQNIMETYTGDHYDPTLVVADLVQGQIYVYKGMLADDAEVQTWLNDVQQGDINFTTELMKKEWKPHNPGFDFLKMIDEEESRTDQKSTHILEDIDDFDEAELHDDYDHESIDFQGEFDQPKALHQARHTEL